MSDPLLKNIYKMPFFKDFKNIDLKIASKEFFVEKEFDFEQGMLMKLSEQGRLTSYPLNTPMSLGQSRFLRQTGQRVTLALLFLLHKVLTWILSRTGYFSLKNNNHAQWYCIEFSEYPKKNVTLATNLIIPIIRMCQIHESHPKHPQKLSLLDLRIIRVNIYECCYRERN